MKASSAIIVRRNICYCRIGCTDGVRFNVDFTFFAAAAAAAADGDNATAASTTAGDDDDDEMFCESLCSIAIN